MVLLPFRENGAPSALAGAERRKAEVLVQDFHLCEADLAQQVELEEQRARRVLLFDIGENLVPVGFVLQPDQVLAIALAYQPPDRRNGTLDQIEDPHRSASPQRPMER